MRTRLQQILAHQLRHNLTERGWTQAALSRASGYTQKHICRMLSGKIEGSLTCWERLLDVSGTGAAQEKGQK